PLSDNQTARLLAGLMEQPVIPAEIQATVLRQAEGNPLYAQEYVRMLHDRRLLVRRGDAWVVPEGAELPLPETVQGLIAARIDALGGDERTVLQDASVIGKVAWTGAVATIGELTRPAVE